RAARRCHEKAPPARAAAPAIPTSTPRRVRFIADTAFAEAVSSGNTVDRSRSSPGRSRTGVHQLTYRAQVAAFGQRGKVAAVAAALALQRAAQVVVAIDGDQDGQVALPPEAERRHVAATGEMPDLGDVVVDAFVEQVDLQLLGIVGEDLQVD